jgi:hypothetical protein
MTPTQLTSSEQRFLRDAAAYLENQSFLMKLADLIGEPLQKLASRVVPAKVAQLGDTALRKAMDIAVVTVPNADHDTDLEQAYGESGWTGLWHRLAATVSGGAGGVFGWPGLVIELPVTTGILFRSIGAIASDFGEDLTSPETRLECLTVFSHGGPSPDDDAMEASFITSRIAMSKLVRDAARYVGEHGAKAASGAIANRSAPALVTLINRVAAEFNVTVSQKVLAQSMPLISIATGAVINNAFADHFNRVARFHFGMRKLERCYGEPIVHAAYRSQLADLRTSPRLRRSAEPSDAADSR